MKLRIRGNSVRFRLTQTEVVNLVEQGLVEEKTNFGNQQTLVYAVATSSETETVKATFANNRLEILLPQIITKNWAESEEVGISGEDNALQILVEKDFNCLIPRNSKEDADTFPHPNQEKIC